MSLPGDVLPAYAELKGSDGPIVPVLRPAAAHTPTRGTPAPPALPLVLCGALKSTARTVFPTMWPVARPQVRGCGTSVNTTVDPRASALMSPPCPSLHNPLISYTAAAAAPAAAALLLKAEVDVIPLSPARPAAD